MENVLNYIIQFAYFAVALLIVMSVHECSHAMAAYYLGDPTAKIRGRLTLNPIAHLDPLGTLVFLITQRIGWGKPVPINPNNFKNPIRDSALSALAGPLSNFLLAFAIALPLKYIGDFMPVYLQGFLWMTFDVSIVLGIFNFFPFPPLDGSKIFALLIPRRFYPKYDHFLEKNTKYFVAIILIDVFILGGILGFSFLGWLMGILHEYVRTIILLGT